MDDRVPIAVRMLEEAFRTYPLSSGTPMPESAIVITDRREANMYAFDDVPSDVLVLWRSKYKNVDHWPGPVWGEIIENADGELGANMWQQRDGKALRNLLRNEAKRITKDIQRRMDAHGLGDFVDWIGQYIEIILRDQYLHADNPTASFLWDSMRSGGIPCGYDGTPPKGRVFVFVPNLTNTIDARHQSKEI